MTTVASSGSDPDVLCVGIAVCDILAGPTRHPLPVGALQLVSAIEMGIGGCAVNAAHALTTAGVRTRLVAATGTDELGHYVRREVSAAGIDAHWIDVSDAPTSSSTILVGEDGERTILHCIGSNGHLRLDDITPHLAGTVLYVGGALVMPDLDGEPLAELLAMAKRLGMTTVLDVVYDATDNWHRVDAALPETDVFCPSRSEAMALTGQRDPAAAAAELRGRGVGLVSVTGGPAGAWLDSDDYTGHIPALNVSTIDETGAGDAYSAGMIVGIMNDFSPLQCARLAAATGALATTRTGASAGHYNLDTILDLVAMEIPT